MSASFPRVDNSPTTLIPPGQTDIQTGLSKLDQILNGPLDAGIHRQMGRHLLDNADEYTGTDPYEWGPGRTKEFDIYDGDAGVASKPKDPRLKKDKDDGGDGTLKNDGSAKSSTLQDLFKADDPQVDKQKADAFNQPPAPYNRDEYYKKNPDHLDLGAWTDRLNQMSYDTKVREDEAERLAQGGQPRPGTDGTGAKNDDSFAKNPFAPPEVKRTGLSAEVGFGNYTPVPRASPFSTEQIERDSWHAGYENVERQDDGSGYSQTNLGAWRVSENGQSGSSASVGVGARAEAVQVFDVPGGGEVTVRGNVLAGGEASGGGKLKFGAAETTVAAGAEARAGIFGEAGATYRPVEFQTTILGAPIDLSPEISAAGRAFTGGEIGAGFKAGWRMVPDPTTGKVTPEAGIEAKGSAFIGGKVEAEGSVGMADVGSVGGSVAGLYGVGVEGKAKLGLGKDDKGRLKLKFEFKGAAALGLGLGWGFKGEINVDGLMRFGARVARANREVINKVKEGVNTAVNAVKNGVNTAVDKTKEAVNTAVDKAKEAVNTVVDKGKEVVNKVEDGLKNAAKKVKGLFGKIF